MTLANAFTQYCSKECQKGHWRVHNDDCKAPLRTEAFLPNFCYEARVPVDYIFPGAEQLNTPHLWSTSPAMDVLNLQSNEGERFNGNLFVLFAGKWLYKHVAGFS